MVKISQNFVAFSEYMNFIMSTAVLRSDKYLKMALKLTSSYFCDYRWKTSNSLVILPEHFSFKIVYEMAHLLEKKSCFFLCENTLHVFQFFRNKLQICYLVIALKRRNILKILTMPCWNNTLLYSLNLKGMK